MSEVSKLAKKLLRLATLGGVVAATGGLALSASGCATPAGSAYTNCPDGKERVRIGPRGQAPKYICRDVKQARGA